MDVLSPRSTNLTIKPRTTMKKPKQETQVKPAEKPSNPDRIDDQWIPPLTVTEPGPAGETYMTGHKLGKGGFAVCFEGRTKSKSEVFALKVVKAHVEQKKMMEKFRTELQIHAKMQHPNIVEFFRAFTLDRHTYVVLEMCDNGNLTDMVKARSCLSLPEVRRFMIQICGGVKYMHKRNVIHRDLKMGNIFLDAGMNLKIGDFGLAAVMADEQDRRTTLCGTPNYIAPEILSKTGARGHDNKVDTWAVGVICYAMLMGTPPFQSKTQQEIYTKLKTLEYEWKIDSKNYIPQQAKDFVAACLNLVSTERPEMDDLVDHAFFTMGAIADTLDTTCLKAKPLWLENADPRGDRVKSGYGVSHPQICKDCGVGQTADGRPRPAVGGKALISTLVEIEAENRLGCAPVVPLPEGILYKQFAQAHVEWSARQKHPLMPPKVRSQKVNVQGPSALEAAASSDLGQSNHRSALPVPATQGPTAVMSRPTQSFAALQRQQALPLRSLPKQSESQQNRDSVKVMTVEEQAQPTSGLLRARPVRAASSHVTRSATLRDSQATISSSTRPKSGAGTAGLKNTERFDAEMAEGTTDSKPAKKACTVGHAGLAHQVNPRAARNGIPEYTTAERPSSSSSDSAGRVLKATSGNDRQRPTATVPIAQTSDQNGKPQSIGSASAPHLDRVRSQHQPRLIASTDSYTRMKNTSHADIMVSLRNLCKQLSATSSSDGEVLIQSTQGRRQRPMRAPYPRVDKWVDYATRHGIAYILTDATLGMILKSSESSSHPSSCVVVRSARTHTIRRAKGKEQQLVPQGPNASDVEFYEKHDELETTRRLDIPARTFQLELDNASSSTTAANAMLQGLEGCEAHRMKEVSLLDKFGKYMNKQSGSGESSDESDLEPSSHFIHFYQRLGNVGVWRFSHGGLQFNFPDHTKLVIYADNARLEGGMMLDSVYLEPRDARELARHGLLTNEALERRAVATWALEDVLQGALRRSELEIVKSNEIKEKLSWIRAVLGCWVKEGGLGMMGDERLGWSGLQERRDDKRIKLQWVTVGRPGGDDEPATSR